MEKKIIGLVQKKYNRVYIAMVNNGFIILVVYSFLTGFGSYFVKVTHNISAQQLIFFRALFACIFLLLLAVSRKKSKELHFRFPVNTIIMAIAQGLLIYFYYLALERTTIANAVLLVYTAPVFSVVLSHFVLREKVERKTLFAICLSFLGVLIISDPYKIQLHPQHFLGSLFALLGGLFYSVMAISSKTLSHKTTPLYAAFWQYCIIFILWSFFSLPVQPKTVGANIVPILYLGWAAGGLAFYLYMKGIQKVKGQIIQIVTMLEIPISALTGVLLLGERLAFQTIVGGVFILLSVYIVTSKK